MTVKINADTTSGLQLESDTSGEIDLQTNGTTKVHMDSSGNVGIGTTNPDGALTIQATGASDITYKYTDGNTKAFSKFDNSDFTFKEGTVGNDAYAFFTANTEHMRIASTGYVTIGTTSGNPASQNVTGFAIQQSGFFSAQRDGGATVNIGRAQDGTLLNFFSAGNVEGTISVSGTTVSYNGGHLSRWGRLSDNSQPTILKGTVMSNLDEMVVWSYDDVLYTEEDELPVDDDGNPTASVGDVKKPAYTAENEQRNQLKVSDVEGDINVAGLFVKWDTEEDGYNDIDLAMTGDMIIRIAQGTTVQRGDLLMSAGDGTAKPQGDDIVRSKTIAKVTSTTVINTYDDGSYVVPCVVMAC